MAAHTQHFTADVDIIYKSKNTYAQRISFLGDSVMNGDNLTLGDNAILGNNSVKRGSRAPVSVQVKEGDLSAHLHRLQQLT